MVHATLHELRDCLSILHASEKHHFESFKYDLRKTSYLLGRVAAKNAVSMLNNREPASVVIDYGVFEFPIIRQNGPHNLQISVSHCDHIGVALAFPEAHPLGVDLEKADADKLEAMKSHVTESELQLISHHRLEDAIGCTILWTIKESLSKVLRTGLMMDHKVIQINSIQQVGAMYESTFLYFGQYKALSMICGQYVCSIILPRRTICDLNHFQSALDIIVRDQSVIFP